MRGSRASSSGALASGILEVILAEAEVLARRPLTEQESDRFRRQAERLRLVEERRASAQLEQLASAVRGMRERIERTERDRDEWKDRAERAERALAGMHEGDDDDGRA